MEYIILLDYTDGEVIKIRLSEQETILGNEAEDFEEFLRTLEERYDFINRHFSTEDIQMASKHMIR